MSRVANLLVEITPQVLLKAYACGIFPMAESADDPGLYWIEPEHRGVIPLDGLTISRRLARTVRSDRFEVVVDRDFEAVIDACAAPTEGRRTHLDQPAHPQALWRSVRHSAIATRSRPIEDGRLVGGLYGVDLGGAFFGESMFHRARDASKVALVHLVARLRHGGYRLLDTQFVTDHLVSLGAVEVPRRDYHRLLEHALRGRGDFLPGRAQYSVSGAEALDALSAALSVANRERTAFAHGEQSLVLLDCAEMRGCGAARPSPGIDAASGVASKSHVEHRRRPRSTMFPCSARRRCRNRAASRPASASSDSSRENSTSPALILAKGWSGS